MPVGHHDGLKNLDGILLTQGRWGLGLARLVTRISQKHVHAHGSVRVSSLILPCLIDIGYDKSDKCDGERQVESFRHEGSSKTTTG